MATPYPIKQANRQDTRRQVSSSFTQMWAVPTYIAPDDTVYIEYRHQMIVVGTLEIDGTLDNQGSLVIL